MTRERAAGIVVPLSALRRERDSGIGEYPDLIPLAEWARDHGLRILGLLPLGESAETSPYGAISTFALEPLYVSLEEIPELTGDGPARDAAPGLLEREAVAARKRPAFERAFSRFAALGADDPRARAFADFEAREAAWLGDYALFRALVEAAPERSWRDWPRGLRDREPAALAEARERHAARIHFWAWLQFVADEQWRRARARLHELDVRIYGDLPFAPAVHSADVWANRDDFDLGRSAGAPPDDFSATGQNWGLPKYAWAAQRRSGWRSFRSRMRRLAELYDLVRIDHVVGLFRTWSFDDAGEGDFDPPEEEAQIAQGREILGVLRDAAAPTRLLAEDLGVIPEFVRETMLDLDLPGYKIFRWVTGEDGETWLPASEYPECSLAATGTHDTDTLVGWWRDAPAEERRQALAFVGRDAEAEEPPPEIDDALRRRLIETLYRSPARYVAIPIQDLFGWPDRINVPATIGGQNWRWRLPIPIERLPPDPTLRPLANSTSR